MITGSAPRARKLYTRSSALCRLPLRGPQGLREIVREVVRVFEPDRKPQQVLGGGRSWSFYGRPVFDVAVRPPEARRPREHANVGRDGYSAPSVSR